MSEDTKGMQFRQADEDEKFIMDDIIALAEEVWDKNIFPPRLAIVIGAALGRILAVHDDSGGFDRKTLLKLLVLVNKTILLNYDYERSVKTNELAEAIAESRNATRN